MIDLDEVMKEFKDVATKEGTNNVSLNLYCKNYLTHGDICFTVSFGDDEVFDGWYNWINLVSDELMARIEDDWDDMPSRKQRKYMGPWFEKVEYYENDYDYFSDIPYDEAISSLKEVPFDSYEIIFG